MDFAELIRETAILGYVLGGVLVALGITVLILLFISRNQDDGFESIGQAVPYEQRPSEFRRLR
jgi:hypothetical protein